jgi:hypothetical protein
MDHYDFQNYYATPTKIIKTTLLTFERFVCHPRCTPNCLYPCRIHQPPRTLSPQFVTDDHTIYPLLCPSPIHPALPPHPVHPRPPHYITQNLIQYPISYILDHKEHRTLDNNKVTKKFVSYLCQWTTPHQQTYHKWLIQHKILPWRNPNPTNPNITPLIQYYKRKQNTYYTNLLNAHFITKQPKDPKHIPPPISLPLISISTNECNPDNDIDNHTPTIQLQHDCAHIYEQHGKHLITIPTDRLKWLWIQYNNFPP